MLKKDFFGDPKVGKLPPGCRLLFQSLWIYADDTGHGIAEPQLLKAQAFPYDDISVETIEQWLGLLAGLGMVLLYEVSAQKYFHVVNFLEHQTVNKPSSFEYPKPCAISLPEPSGSTTVVLREDYELKEKGKEKGKGERKKGKSAAGADFENRKMADPRFESLKKAYFEQFSKKSPNLKAPFDAGDGKMLKNLLIRQPDATSEQLAKWLSYAFDSDDVPPLRPMFRLREFCTHAEKYVNGPLKRGGAPPVRISTDPSSASQIERLVI